MKGHITKETTFGVGEQTKQVKARYLVIHAPFSYNMIIGRPTFNQLYVILSTLYLCMKYALFDG